MKQLVHMTDAVPPEGLPSPDQSPHWLVAIVVLLLLLILAVVPRTILVRQAALEYDELVAIDHFLRQPIGRTLTEFDVGANHPLYNLLSRATTRYVMDTWNVRLPALVAGVVAVPVLFWMLRPVTGIGPAAAAAAALALAKSHIDHSAFARGYTLAALGVIVSQGMLIAGLRSNRWAAWFGYALASVLAAYSHLWTLLAVFAQLVFVLLGMFFKQRLPWKRFLISFLSLLGVLALLYAPMMGDILARLATPPDEPFGPRLWGAICSNSTMGQPNVGPGEWTLPVNVFMLGCIVVTLFKPEFIRSQAGMLHVTMVVMVLAVVGTVRPASFFPRYLLFLLPLYFGGFACALASLLQHARARASGQNAGVRETDGVIGSLKPESAVDSMRGLGGTHTVRTPAWNTLFVIAATGMLVASVLVMVAFPSILDKWEWFEQVPYVVAALLLVADLARCRAGHVRPIKWIGLGAAGTFLAAALASDLAGSGTDRLVMVTIVFVLVLVVAWAECKRDWTKPTQAPAR